jgi:Arc/MetJ-type ribon-helix-helix transcriptional regulator
MKVINLRIPDDTYMDLQAEVRARNYKSRVEGSGLTATKSSLVRVALETWLTQNSEVRERRRKWMEEAMANEANNTGNLDDQNDDGGYPPDE